MMFISGLMMAISGINGNGNDTKTIPAIIIIFGLVLGIWGIYRLGYVKSNIDKEETARKRDAERRVFRLQFVEAIVYFIIMGLGVYLYINENFTNTVLDLICGGFTIFNGVMGSIWIYKNRAEKNFSWKFRIFLTALEFSLGLYFIFGSNTINSVGYLIMGSVTTVAGTIEIIHALRENALKDAIKDTKDIFKTLKSEKEDSEDPKEQ